MSKLFVNIDHIATLREARKIKEPSPLMAMYECELMGVSGVTLHLREDQRHIKKEDVLDIKRCKNIPMNLESSLDKKIVDFVCKIRPEITCIVPERRDEITTEGGLDVIKYKKQLEEVIKEYTDLGIEVSLFIDADKEMVDLAKEMGCHSIEINTGRYSNSSYLDLDDESQKIRNMIDHAYGMNLKVNLGHGLNYYNIKPFIGNNKISEFNIGHSIIARSIFVGFRTAVKEMKDLIEF